MNVTQYAKEQPTLVLEQYFQGKLQGHGIFMDRSGEVKRRFVVNITGTLSADKKTLTLDEQFVWSDGVKDARVWTLKKQASSSPEQWIGTAADVVGSAQGLASGNALNWKYVLALPVDSTVYHVNFDDWMYLVDDNVMINKAVMSKFGFRLGEVLISFQKVP
jgi:Protein of unknown function (DUF3833)